MQNDSYKWITFRQIEQEKGGEEWKRTKILSAKWCERREKKEKKTFHRNLGERWKEEKLFLSFVGEIRQNVYDIQKWNNIWLMSLLSVTKREINLHENNRTTFTHHVERETRARIVDSVFLLLSFSKSNLDLWKFLILFRFTRTKTFRTTNMLRRRRFKTKYSIYGYAEDDEMIGPHNRNDHKTTFIALDRLTCADISFNGQCLERHRYTRHKRREERKTQKIKPVDELTIR